MNEIWLARKRLLTVFYEIVMRKLNIYYFQYLLMIVLSLSGVCEPTITWKLENYTFAE